MLKNRYYACTLMVASWIIFVSFAKAPKPDDSVPYPEGYREWTHVKTYIVGPKNPVFKFIGGFNHVYANEKAMIGYRTGDFPNGSMIVSDVIEAKEDTMDIREGKRHHIDVMIRDSTKYPDAGGWRFEQFFEDSNTTRLLTPEIRVVCSNCHAKQKDHVFSEYRK